MSSTSISKTICASRRQGWGEGMRLATLLAALTPGLLASYGCAGTEGGDAPVLGETSQAMIDLGDGLNCGNCVGGDCVELHCFEDWTHGGAGPQGPYDPGGGGYSMNDCALDREAALAQCEFFAHSDCNRVCAPFRTPVATRGALARAAPAQPVSTGVRGRKPPASGVEDVEVPVVICERGSQCQGSPAAFDLCLSVCLPTHSNCLSRAAEGYASCRSGTTH